MPRSASNSGCKECYLGDHDNCRGGNCQCPTCFVSDDYDADELGLDPEENYDA